MLQFIVLGHVGGKDFRECLNLRGQLKFSDEPVSVLFKLLWLDLLVSIQLVNSLVELSDFLTALLILASFVVAKVFEKDLSRELSERSGKHVRFELKELVNHILVRNSIKDVCSKIDDILKRLIQKMTLQAKLQFTYILSCDAFVVEGKQFGPYGHRIDVLEAYWEKHLTVSMKFL